MKRTRRYSILLLLSVLPAFATTRLDLDRDWEFRVDPQQAGEASGWQRQVPADTESVDLPHTWNIGKYENYLGKAWYFRRFQTPMESPGIHVELHFGASFYSSRVWLNGVEVGRHEGGYTGYSFDVTSYLRPTNYLAVELDNRVGEQTIPGFAMRQRSPHDAWYDWWDYGGIVRDVWLTVGGAIQIRRQQITSQLGSDRAAVEDRVFLKNLLAKSKRISVRVAAHEPGNRIAATQRRSYRLQPGESAISVPLTLIEPKLWGVDHPRVYRLTVEIADASGRPLDEQSDTFGLRRIEIRDRHLLINGEQVRLTGLARHEESLSEGLAETVGTMRSDYDDMKSLQMTMTRPVHYPQNPFILDYADRQGILLIPEIPVWQFSESQLSDPRVIDLAKQQMKEMIEQTGNHPSIFAWSVCNESDTATPGGVAYFRLMRDFIKQLDPGRFVTYADDNLPKLGRAEDSAANDADFLMMNQYFGSWHGPKEALAASLDKIDRMFPRKMVIISEFGLHGSFAKDGEDADRKRVEVIQEQMPELAQRDWIAGAILWCYQDYKSRRNLRRGLEEGYVDHGVVDEYRQRKPSYYVWKEMNAPAAISVEWNKGSEEVPGSFTATVRPNSADHLPSYPLRDYRLVWDVYDDKKLLVHGDQPIPDLTEVRVVSLELRNPPGTSKLRLHLSLLRPTGTVASEKTLDWDISGQQASRSEKALAPGR